MIVNEISLVIQNKNDINADKKVNEISLLKGAKNRILKKKKEIIFGLNKRRMDS